MISPLDKILLQCVARILEEKKSLVRVGFMFDNQFLSIVGFSGFPTHAQTLVDEMTYLEKEGFIERLDRSDSYMGKAIHYGLTEKGEETIK